MTKPKAPKRGPASWTNWQAHDPDGAREMREVALYSDSSVAGYLRRPDWPLDLISTFARPGSSFPLVARIRWYGATTPLDLDNPEITTSDDAYHGGDDADEVAALLSLALGIRCRSGGVTRNWWTRPDDGQDYDELGYPDESDHRPPAMPPPLHRRGRVLPRLPDEVNVADAQELLSLYGQMEAGRASLLVQAARQYANALWAAESDPNQAWLHLVSAVEVVSSDIKLVKPLWQRLETAWPELWGLLKDVKPEQQRNAIGDLLAPDVRVTGQFVQFLMARLAPPPAARATEDADESTTARVDWDKMAAHLQRIYRYRSRALHAGRPFPLPMCEPPIEWGEVPGEQPSFHGTWTQNASWAKEDVPMYLHLFEYLVRHALLTWWGES